MSMASTHEDLINEDEDEWEWEEDGDYHQQEPILMHVGQERLI